MKKLLVYPVVSALVVGGLLSGAGAQSQTPLPPAGIMPASRLYFLDQLGEFIEKFFTFNPEAKARLEVSFAAERIAEIKIMLETKGVSARGFTVAEDRLRAHFATADSILEKQKAAGRDVSALAKELNDEIKTQKDAIKQSFNDREDALEDREDELNAKISEARGVGDTATVEALLKELADVKAEMDLLELKEDEEEDLFELEIEIEEDLAEDQEDDEEDAEIDELEHLPEIDEIRGKEWRELENLERELN